MLLKSKRVGEENRQYWRCSSFRGKHGTEVAGRTFTPPPMALWSKYPGSSYARYRSKHRKLPEERQMLIADKKDTESTINRLVLAISECDDEVYDAPMTPIKWQQGLHQLFSAPRTDELGELSMYMTEKAAGQVVSQLSGVYPTASGQRRL